MTAVPTARYPTPPRPEHVLALQLLPAAGYEQPQAARRDRGSRLRRPAPPGRPAQPARRNGVALAASHPELTPAAGPEGQDAAVRQLRVTGAGSPATPTSPSGHDEITSRHLSIRRDTPAPGPRPTVPSTRSTTLTRPNSASPASIDS